MQDTQVATAVWMATSQLIMALVEALPPEMDMKQAMVSRAHELAEASPKLLPAEDPLGEFLGNLFRKFANDLESAPTAQFGGIQ